MAERYAKLAIIDAGCGYGNFTAALIEAGCGGAIGIDLMHEKLENAFEDYPVAAGRLFPGDTTTHPIVKLPDAVIIFARPCHDATWIADTFEHAKATAKTFLYISKRGNEVTDLEGFERRRVAHTIEIGEEGEIIWEFRAVPKEFAGEEPVRWCLIEYNRSNEKPPEHIWVREGRKKWFWNWSPSYAPKRDETVLTEACVASDDFIDVKLGTKWQKWHERVNDTTLDNGWVSPEGKLYRCAYWEHDSMVYDYLQMTTTALEKGGWCKVQKSDDMSQTLFIIGRYADRESNLTKEQVQALLDGGFKIPWYYLEDAEGDWSAEIERMKAKEA
jgi:hypothetical protein